MVLHAEGDGKARLAKDIAEPCVISLLQAKDALKANRFFVEMCSTLSRPAKIS